MPKIRRGRSILKNKLLIVILIFISITLFAQNRNGNEIMKSGLNNFSKGNYTEALGDFREIILNNNFESLQGTAYYWISRTYSAQNLLDKAENNLDFFIQNYPDNKLYPDAVYQKGRILFKNNKFDTSIQIFYKFIESYPDHPYVANSYYWIAESLYSLGHLEEAKSIFSMIVREYPNSYKFEASNYKLSLITLKFRENELLKLLKISHEEYLEALVNFQRKEKVYEQSISNYQRKLNAVSSNDQKNIISEMSNELLVKNKSLSDMKAEIEQLNASIDNLKEQLSNKTGESAAVTTKPLSSENTTGKVQQLLDSKNTALQLKEFYINWLSSRNGE